MRDDVLHFICAAVAAGFQCLPLIQPLFDVVVSMLFRVQKDNGIIDLEHRKLMAYSVWFYNLNDLLAFSLIFYLGAIVFFLNFTLEHLWWKYTLFQTVLVFLVSILSSPMLCEFVFGWDIAFYVSKRYAPALFILICYWHYHIWAALIRGPEPEHVSEMLDLKGKVVIVTGASSGIGKETATRLAKLGATVIIPNRSIERGEEARRYITRKSGNTDVHILQINMSSLKSVRKFAEEFKSKFNKLDIIVSNAGLMNFERMLTEDKHEENLHVNHYSPALMILLLLPLMKKSDLPGGPRIVSVNSSMLRLACYRHGGFMFDDLLCDNYYEMFTMYGRSKLAAWHFNNELSRRLNKNGKHKVAVNSLMPGSIQTSITRDFNYLIAIGQNLIRPVLKTQFSGANTQVYLAAAKDVHGHTAKYFENSVEVPLPKGAYSDEDAKKVWEHTMKVLDIDGDKIIEEFVSVHN